MALVTLHPEGREGKLYCKSARVFELPLFEVTFSTESAPELLLGLAWFTQLSALAVTVCEPGVEHPPPVFLKAR